MNNKKIIIGIGIIIIFSLITLALTTYFDAQQEKREKGHLTSEMIQNMSKEEIIKYMDAREKNHPSFGSHDILPIIALIGLLVGTIVFYIMSDDMMKKEKNNKKNNELIMKFFPQQEKEIILKILENKGKVGQYELTHIPNMNKLKIHRILTNLEQKGIIKKEKIGKINKIILEKEYFELLK